MNAMFLYFVYGSNMNPARMSKRCPGAIDLGGAILRNHWVIERLYADIDFAEGAEMQGVLYVITEEHLRKLDRYEGYPWLYDRQLFPAKLANGTDATGWSYIMHTFPPMAKVIPGGDWKEYRHG